jgi:hypothetical protein
MEEHGGGSQHSELLDWFNRDGSKHIEKAWVRSNTGVTLLHNGFTRFFEY